MKGGNGATNGSGITQFAEGEPKMSRGVHTKPTQPKTILDRGRKSAKEVSRKVRKVRKVLKNQTRSVHLEPR